MLVRPLGGGPLVIGTTLELVPDSDALDDQHPVFHVDVALTV
jgi:hypothetical protein